MRIRKNDPKRQETRNAICEILKRIPPEEYAHLRNPGTVSGWRYVYRNGLAFIGKLDGRPVTQAWEDPQLCAAEMHLLKNITTALGVAYVKLLGEVPAHATSTAAPLVVAEVEAAPPVPPTSTGIPEWDADPDVMNIFKRMHRLQEAARVLREAGRNDDAKAVIGQLAELQLEFTRATKVADRRAAERARGQAKDVLADKLANDPAFREIIETIHTSPKLRTPAASLHDYATEKARAAFAATLQGDHSYVPTHINLRPSVDYAVVQGVMSYWYHWIGAKMGSIQDPVFDNIGLDNPLAAPEIRRLLAQGIPADFLYHPQTKQLLHDMSDPAGPPATGFPCTIGAAAMLVHLRPATHLVPWQPLPDDAACDVGMLADFVMGYDPKQTAMTGRAQPLKLPSYLRGADAQRFPVLTVPEAFLTWTLAIAAASGVGSGYAKVVLSAQTAVDRVAAYTNLRVSRAFGQTSTVENWKNISQLWTSRRALGEPESEIRADLGDPPVRPDLEPDWHGPVLRLKAAVIEQLPMFAHWASMPALLHGAGQRFEPLDVLGELDRAKTPPALPPAPEPKPARAPVLMPWITPAPWDDETA